MLLSVSRLVLVPQEIEQAFLWAKVLPPKLRGSPPERGWIGRTVDRR